MAAIRRGGQFEALAEKQFGQGQILDGEKIQPEREPAQKRAFVAFLKCRNLLVIPPQKRAGFVCFAPGEHRAADDAIFDIVEFARGQILEGRAPGACGSIGGVSPWGRPKTPRARS